MGEDQLFPFTVATSSIPHLGQPPRFQSNGPHLQRIPDDKMVLNEQQQVTTQGSSAMIPPIWNQG